MTQDNKLSLSKDTACLNVKFHIICREVKRIHFILMVVCLKSSGKLVTISTDSGLVLPPKTANGRNKTLYELSVSRAQWGFFHHVDKTPAYSQSEVFNPVTGKIYAIFVYLLGDDEVIVGSAVAAVKCRGNGCIKWYSSLVSKRGRIRSC